MLYEPDWRKGPGGKGVAKKQKLVELLALVRVEVQKRRDVKRAKTLRPVLKGKKGKKATLPDTDSAAVGKLREHRFYQNLCVD